jgi:type IV pilus assembly protein PilM
VVVVEEGAAEGGVGGGQEDDEMRVLLVAAKKSYIDEHVDVLERCHLKPFIIDVDSFALGNLYELTGILNQQAINWSKVVALINIGASKTNINVVRGGNSYFTREIYIGGNDFTETLVKKLNIETGEAERMKINPEAEATVREATFSVLEDLCHEINLSIDFFENQYDKKVEDFYLCGGAAQQVGLNEAFQRFFDTEPTLWNPAMAFDVDPTRVNPQALQEYGSQMAVALGLASRVRPE